MRAWVTTATSVVLVMAVIAMKAKTMRHDADRDRQDVGLDHLEQGGVGAGELVDRDDEPGGHGHQHVDDAGRDHAADERPREASWTG